MNNTITKYLVIDVDGTLTDGKINMSNSGELFKAFDIKDCYAITHILPENNIVPIIITDRKSNIVSKRCDELDIKHCCQECEDKESSLRDLMDKLNVSTCEEKYKDVAYIGDDLIDLPCMEICGITACPADAARGVMKHVDYICSKNGGSGAVREFIEYLVKRNNYLSTQQNAKFVWNSFVLSSKLPKPESDRGLIIVNTAVALVAYISETSQENYNAYKQKCKKSGFVIDSESTASSYMAYNEKGYKLQLLYNGYIEELNIILNTPIEMTKYVWPTYGPAKSLPAPKSSIGKIIIASNSKFQIYVGDISKKDYDTYVLGCTNSGFNVNCSDTENSYEGCDSNGSHLYVSYEGYNIMQISVIAPSPSGKTTQPDTTEPTTIPTATKQSTNQKATTTATAALTEPITTKPTSSPAISAPATSSSSSATSNPPSVVKQPAAASNMTTGKAKTYILNENVKKFHCTDCHSVAKMSPANKKEFTGTRDDIIGKGYKSCKRCNP